MQACVMECLLFKVGGADTYVFMHCIMHLQNLSSFYVTSPFTIMLAMD